MKLPFTTQDFFNIFKQYNNAVFPIQAALILLATVCIFFVVKNYAAANKIILLTLSFFWLWMGVVYHLLFFTRINKAAYFFGVAFILQAIIFLLLSFKNAITFKIQNNLNGVAAACLICYSLLIYPFIGYVLHHRYPASPTFGLPCPTTIFTFGTLLISSSKLPVYVFVIPIIWSFIGTIAALELNMQEDFGLTVSALVFLVLFSIRNIKLNKLAEVR